MEEQHKIEEEFSEIASRYGWRSEGFLSEKDYEEHYVALVDDLLLEAEKSERDIQQRRMRIDKRLEEMSQTLSIGHEATNVNIVPQAIEEAVALMVENLPRAKAVARGSEDKEFAGQLSAAMDQEYDSNDFEGAVLPKVLWNSKKFYLGIVKVVWDRDMPGEFNNKGGNRLVSIDPRLFHIDPKAKGYTRKDMRYIVVEEPMDLSEVRARYPHKNVEPEGDGISEIRTKDPAFKSIGSEYVIGQRHRVIVKECWLNSDVMHEVEVRDAQGNCIYDKEGKERTKWVKKYPNGRLIITANGKMLVNIPNPYAHGEFPYAIYASRISGRILSWGDAEPLFVLADKMNRLLKDAMANLRISMNTPWIADRHAFGETDKHHLLTNQPGLVILKNPQSEVARLPAGELPQSYFLFYQEMRKLFDDVLGSYGVQRGQLEKGAQLSADAVTQLQSASLARSRLKARMFENFLKRVGWLLQWNERQFFDSDYKVAVTKPGSKEKVIIGWSGEESKGQYNVGIEVGSSLPGAKESNANLIMRLWEKGLLPRDWAVRMMEVPNAEAMIEDIKTREDELASKVKGGIDDVMKRRYRATPGIKGREAV